MKKGSSNAKKICPILILVLLMPFAFVACSTDQKVSQNGFSSQVRPWRGNAEAYYQLACHYQDRNRHREALEEFRKMLAVNPADVRAYNGIGISCDALKEFPRAFMAYEKALKLNPQAGYVYNNLGYSYVMQNRYEEAVQSFTKAVELAGGSDTRKKIDYNLALAQSLSKTPNPVGNVPQQDLKNNPQSQTVAKTTGFEQDRHIRNLIIQRDPLALRLPSPAPSSSVAGTSSASSPKTAVSIEIANGNGIRYMARNIGNYLKKRGYNVVRVTNADSYSYRKGNVGYRLNGQATAEEIAAIFPADVDVKKMKGRTGKDVRVRVLVGKDLIPYKKVFTEDQG